MTKRQTIFSCSKCGAQFPKWSGRCLDCGAWGSLNEDARPAPNKESLAGVPAAKPISFTDIGTGELKRIKTGIAEIDRVLGGGIVPGSLVLLGGEPGIGKSTLILQIAEAAPSCLYISGEESASQVKARVDRLSIKNSRLRFLSEVNIETILATIAKEKPELAIIDSIQTMYSRDIPSEAGSVSQIRAGSAKLLEEAKRSGTAVFIVGHVTKEGLVAGPKTLEHLVDTVLYLETDAKGYFRLLRSHKNRFGSTNELGIFEMTSKGMKEVKNPSAVFLEDREAENIGSIITSTTIGSQTFFAEVQALVSKTVFGYPQRKSSGFDLNRLQVLLAVLTRKLDLPLGMQDVYLNIAGGFKIQDTSADLAVCLAIISALKNTPLSRQTLAFGEVGLAGEVRNIPQGEKMASEGKKMGFKKIIMPNNKAELSGAKITKIKNLGELLIFFK